jgi:hypothetical protein
MALPFNPQGTSDALRFIKNLVYGLLIAVVMLTSILIWHIVTTAGVQKDLKECSESSKANAKYIEDTVQRLETCEVESNMLRGKYIILQMKAEAQGLKITPLNE